MASDGLAPKVRSEAVDSSSLGPLSGELKQVTKRLVMAVSSPLGTEAADPSHALESANCLT